MSFPAGARVFSATRASTGVRLAGCTRCCNFLGMACMPDPAFLLLHPMFGNLKCGSLAVQASVLRVDNMLPATTFWAKLRSTAGTCLRAVGSVANELHSKKQQPCGRSFFGCFKSPAHATSCYTETSPTLSGWVWALVVSMRSRWAAVYRRCS